MVRASVMKQRLQELSKGAFDEALQGYKTFRRFLDHYPDLVSVTQEGSTLYVCRAEEISRPQTTLKDQRLSRSEAKVLIGQALDELLVDQSRVRASMLKQKIQELSNGAFDEHQLGAESFRQFLEGYPDVVRIQQRGTTLLVQRPNDYVRPDQLHLRYRSALKKRGLRVIPSEIRLMILKDLVALLGHQEQIQWRKIVDRLAGYYQSHGREDVSKSYVNDVLRLARRAAVIRVQNGGSLAKAPVALQIAGERRFQEAVIMCDATYLAEIRAIDGQLDLDQASIALYENIGHTRYLQVILNRYAQNGQDHS